MYFNCEKKWTLTHIQIKKQKQADTNCFKHGLNVPHATATGTGVGTIRRFLISVGAIVMTVGLVGVLVGVFSLVEIVDRNDWERLSEGEDAGEDTAVSSQSAKTDTRITWSLDVGAFGSRVRGRMT